MSNEMLRDCFSELYPAFRQAYPTPDLSFYYLRRRFAQFFIKNVNVFAIPPQ